MSNHRYSAGTDRARGQGGGATLLAGDAALGELPLWAQVLVAARLLQRAALAMPDELPPALRECIDAVVAAMQDCACAGGGVHRHRACFDAAMAWRDGDAAATTAPLRGLLWYAIDATRAADAAQDFPIDATVMRSTLRGVGELARDARIVPLQTRVLMAGDIDLLRFACDEAAVGRYDAMPDAVFLNLPPVHALTLTETPQDEPSWR